MAAHLDATLRNDVTELGRLTALIEDFGRAHHFSSKAVFTLTLCLDEVVTNIISHGYDDGAEHAIRLQFDLADGALTIIVEDDGKPFDPLTHAAPDLDAPLEDREIGGLGVHFLRTLMDGVEYRREQGRNRLVMKKNLPA